MSRDVSSGDLGLDILLGGGWRLVTRLPDTPSATVVVRGGPGAGKTFVGVHAALAFAKAMGGDVIVACIEILPTEYVEQLDSRRRNSGGQQFFILPEVPSNVEGPRVLCGLLDNDEHEPDLVGALERLITLAANRGARPVAVVVDSLIEGYGIGSSAPRTAVDAVMKFAAQQGYAVVLCEEVRSAEPSPWVFSADTVLELGVESAARGRWVEVRKHRFGQSVSGRHELFLSGWRPPQVFPESHAWAAVNSQYVLHAYGWEFLNGRGMPALVFHESLLPKSAYLPLEAGLALTSSARAGIARTLAIGLFPNGDQRRRDLIIELDPLLVRRDGFTSRELEVLYLPTIHGPARALVELLERFAEFFAPQSSRQAVRRILLGDVATVLAGPDAVAWVEAIRVFSSLVIESGWGIPVVLYDGQATGSATRARSLLGTYADVHIEALRLRTDSRTTQISIRQRWRRETTTLTLGQIENAPLPPELARLDRLPRMHGRGTEPA